ncbi:nucleoside hydrolase [Propionibacterium acidifaciens]|uniref:nucleoside hydrolase n=1 Tax=Propionibacterium acidifaciens TaxID=556499 RepID=UPI0036197AEC
MRLIADVDTGIDDALALVLLAARPDVDLVGVSTTTGNTTAARAARNSAAVLALAGRPGVPVWTGSGRPLVVEPETTPQTHGDEGLGRAALPDASGALHPGDPITGLWLPQLRAHPGETTLLVTGPLTNLALALRAEPRLPRLARRVVIMGGSFNHPGNTLPTSEWNAWCDPHAAAEVYAAFEGLPAERLPLVCPLNVTETVELRPGVLDGIAGRIGVDAPHLGPDAPRPGAPSRTGSALFDLLIDALRFYFEFHADHGCGYLAQVHDLLAAEVAVGEPLGARAEALWVGVETGAGITRGTTVADVRRLLGRAPSARVLTDVDPAAAIDALVRAVVSLSARGGGAGTGREASAVAEGLAT